MKPEHTSSSKNSGMSRMLFALACFLAIAGLVYFFYVKKTPAPASPSHANQIPKLVIPEKGAYTGAYVDFGDAEDDVTLDAVEKFEHITGKKLAIVAFSSFWGQRSFPTRQLEIVTDHDAIPLIYWSPWDIPYEQDHGPDAFSLHSILAGKWDAYIDAWADSAKAYKRPMLVAWGLEMNGVWFPWSGHFYGAGKPVLGQPGKFIGPEIYKKAYHYVIDRVRARGVTNIQWVFHVNNYSYPQDVWNLARQYYPGSDYVDWLALSVYGKQYPAEPWVDFKDLLDYPYTEMAALDPNKPIMLAEWGVGEFPLIAGDDKAQWIREGFERMSTHYPRLKAAVFWHERWQNPEGNYSNLRVNSSPESLKAYREGVANPYWLDKPIWKY
ncbi:MAG: glycosyl hydrolase [Chthoniobacterales bacterium]